MRLATLLGAGKSFFGGQGPVAYRSNKHVYLPKFNAEKNPFAPKPVEAAGVELAKPLAPVMVKVAAATQKIATPSSSKPVAARLARKAGWADKLNPFRAPQPAAEPAVMAVQPELSLDAVKVLHNDLSDADVEVVPVKSRPAGLTAKVVAGPMDYMGEPIGEPVLRTI